VVGLISTSIDFIAYSLLSTYSNFSLSSSKRISFMMGTANSFIFNKTITFKSIGLSFQEPIKYIIVWGISFMLNSLTHDLTSNYFQGYTPFILATLISMLINFTGAKIWVFKK